MGLVLFALHPGHILHSITPLTQLPVAGLLMAVLLLYLISRDRPANWKTLLLGLSLGLLTLVRASCLIIAVAIPLLLYRSTRRINALVIPLVVALAILGAWLVKAHDIGDRFVFVNSANVKNMYYGNNPWTPLYRTWWFGSHTAETDGVPRAYSEQKAMIEGHADKDRDDLYRQHALDHIRTKPAHFMLRSLNRFRVFFAFDIFTGSYLMRTYGLGKGPALILIALDAGVYLLLFFAFLIGSTTSPKDKASKPSMPALIALLGSLYALPYFLSFSHPTYHFPIVPLFALIGLPWIVDGLRVLREHRLGDAWRNFRKSGKRFAVTLALVSLAVFIQIEWVILSVLAP